MGKTDRLHLLILELPARGGKETIHRRLINDGPFLITLALNRPIIAVMGQGNQVDARIVAAQILAIRETLPTAKSS